MTECASHTCVSILTTEMGHKQFSIVLAREMKRRKKKRYKSLPFSLSLPGHMIQPYAADEN